MLDNKTEYTPICLFFCDVDGILCPPVKVFWCKSNIGYNKIFDPRWAKVYSDHDHFVIENMRKELVFCSGDEKNRHFIEYKGCNFLYVDTTNEDKYEAIIREWNRRVKKGLVLGKEDNPNYIYLGDSIYDTKALMNAKLSFIPNDADVLLTRKLTKSNKLGKTIDNIGEIIRLQSKGGEGCLTESILYIYDKYYIISSFRNIWGEMPIFNKIGEYFEA